MCQSTESAVSQNNNYDSARYFSKMGTFNLLNLLCDLINKNPNCEHYEH